MRQFFIDEGLFKVDEIIDADKLAGYIQSDLDYIEQNPGDIKLNPRGIANGEKRVYRGGYFASEPHECRTSARKKAD